MNQTTPMFVQKAISNNDHHATLLATPELPFLNSDAACLTATIFPLDHRTPGQQKATTYSAADQPIVPAHRKAILQERKRIGRELHDNINQLLVCANLYYSQLQVSPEQELLKKKGNELFLQAIGEIRAMSHGLVSSVALSKKNLVSMMHATIENFQQASGITVHFINGLGNKLPTTTQCITIYRILQEQLKNILIHSKANTVSVVLENFPKSFQLTITDDGIGMNSHTSSGGIGLSNIKDRVVHHQGKLNIITAPGNGFSLVVSLPADKRFSPLKRIPNDEERMKKKTA